MTVTPRSKGRRRIAEFVGGAGEGVLETRVREQRQAQLDEFTVERLELRIARIDVHDRRDPFHQHRAALLRAGEPLQGVTPVRIDAGAELEVSVARQLFRQILVRHEHLSAFVVDLAVRVDDPVQGEHDRPADVPRCTDAFAQMIEDRAIASLLNLAERGPERAQVEAELVAVAQGGSQVAAAAAGADPRHVHVHVEDAGGVVRRQRGCPSRHAGEARKRGRQ
jgi:hypothetical protein